MSAAAIGLFLLGLITLIVGAELLVRGATRLAVAFGVSPLIVGLTVVAFGTSAPELAVSVQSALSGKTGVSLGNVVGSNIYNVLVILGLSAVISPLVVRQRLVRLDVPLIIAVCVLLMFLAKDGVLNRFDGLLLVSLLMAYTAFAVIQSRQESKAIDAQYQKEFGEADPKAAHTPRALLLQAALTVAGLVLLVFGSDWMVDAATRMARSFGVSEMLIGLTIVSFGTASPELVTSVVASLRGERDIAVGNVIGSFLFNILGVLGVFAIIAPGGGVPVPQSALRFDLPIMTLVAIACVPIFFNGWRISRAEGALFLAYYLAYFIYLLLNASHSAILPLYSLVMAFFLLPVSALTMLIIMLRFAREERRHRGNEAVAGGSPE